MPAAGVDATADCRGLVKGDKEGVFGPSAHDGQADCGQYCVPMNRTPWILTQSKNSDNELKQTMFHTENTRLLSESAVFALRPYGSLVVGGLQGCHRKASLLMGAVPHTGYGWWDEDLCLFGVTGSAKEPPISAHCEEAMGGCHHLCFAEEVAWPSCCMLTSGHHVPAIVKHLQKKDKRQLNICVWCARSAMHVVHGAHSQPRHQPQPQPSP